MNKKDRELILGKMPLGLKLIGIMKLVVAVLLAAVGLGFFKLLDMDVADTLKQLIGMLHLHAENRFIANLLAKATGMNDTHLRAIGAVSLVYSALHVIEGVGLLLRRHWAEYLVVVITSSLMPFEVYEIIQQPTAIRSAALLINLGIVFYLVSILLRNRRLRASRIAD